MFDKILEYLYQHSPELTIFGIALVIVLAVVLAAVWLAAFILYKMISNKFAQIEAELKEQRKDIRRLEDKTDKRFRRLEDKIDKTRERLVWLAGLVNELRTSVRGRTANKDQPPWFKDDESGLSPPEVRDAAETGEAASISEPPPGAAKPEPPAPPEPEAAE